MIKKLLLLLTITATLAFGSVASFDDLPVFTNVTTQYSNVTFSSDFGGVYVVPFAGTIYNTSSPHGICPSTNMLQCVAPMNVSFSQEMSNVSFLVTVVNNITSGFSLSVNGGPGFIVNYNDVGSFVTHSLQVVANPLNLPYDAYKVTINRDDVLNFRISNQTDLFGTVYDDFTFEPSVAGGGAVPEPLTLLTCGFGLVLVGSKRWRR